MTEPKAQGGYTRLEKTYNYDPIPAAYKGTSLEKYIDGVQGCVWTEFIEEPDHLEYMIYPRLLALAETGMDEATYRLCRLPSTSNYGN